MSRCRGRQPQNLADETLPRRADQHRHAEGGEGVSTAKQLQVLRGGLAETDAGVDGDPVTPDAGGQGEVDLPAKEIGNLGDDVAIHGPILHGRGRALHVHEHDGGASLSGEGRQGGVVAQSGDVVDAGGAGVEGGGGDLGPTRVDEDRGVEAGAADAGDDGHDSAPLLRRVDGIRARPRRLAADVEQVGAVGDQLPGAGDGGGRIQELPAVAERVGRHVDDAHHQRPSGTGEPVGPCVGDGRHGQPFAATASRVSFFR